MSKFCEDCGAEIDDAAVKCQACTNKGVQTSNATADVASNPIKNSASSKGSMNKTLIFGGVGIVAIIAIIIACVCLFSNSYKTPINNMFKGMQKADLKTYLKTFPEFMEADKKFDQEYLDDLLKSYEKEYGKNIKISYKILDKEKLDEEDLEEMEEKIEKYYDEEVKVKAGYDVTVKSTIKGKKDSETSTRTVSVYKIDGKWYLLGI